MDDTAQRINEKVCKTAAEFNALVDVFAQQLLPEQVTAMQKKLALQALRGIVMRTPVDTGRARGNWQVEIGQSNESVLGIVDRKGNALDVSKEAVSQATSAISSAVLAVGERKLQKLPPFDVVFIFNNVSYIIYLEDGTSDQAPQGMVALTFQDLQTQFQDGKAA